MQTKEMVITGMSELHLQIIMERLKRRDKVLAAITSNIRKMGESKVLFDIGKVGRTRLQSDFIRRPTQVANHQLVFRVPLVQQGFEVTEVLSSFQKSIADEGDAATGRNIERQFTRDRRRSLRARRLRAGDRPAPGGRCSPVRDRRSRRCRATPARSGW